MDLIIKKTKITEAKRLLEIQKEAFREDLEKYQDYETSPVNEKIDRLLSKITHFHHYTIWLNGEIIGGIDIRDLGKGKYRLNRIFIANQHQNKGLGSEIMQLIEAEYPNALEWSLDTPHLNIRNHYFYEKLGFVKIGENKVTDKLILYVYKKTLKMAD
ncbi:GNAT family N-acetyltransferase [Ornithinibacillus sp. FSL M8-0202]|uniref:GNAT family N-acetyltransferase n=1 Tax=Ornithinibacillus sp. FSL M8-0202 TaxID=2921616 RepID=UPI0030CDB29B